MQVAPSSIFTGTTLAGSGRLWVFDFFEKHFDRFRSYLCHRIADGLDRDENSGHRSGGGTE